MHKPINVEAQRIQKVIADTLGKTWKFLLDVLLNHLIVLVNLKTLSLLSSEVFEGIQGRQDEEIRK